MPIWKPIPIRFFKSHRIFRLSYNKFYEEINLHHTILCLSQASSTKLKAFDYVQGASVIFCKNLTEFYQTSLENLPYLRFQSTAYGMYENGCDTPRGSFCVAVAHEPCPSVLDFIKCVYILLGVGIWIKTTTLPESKVKDFWIIPLAYAKSLSFFLYKLLHPLLRIMSRLHCTRRFCRMKAHM